VKFFQTHHVKKIMLAGSDDNVAQFRASLPKPVQSLIVGSFTMSMGASHADVLQKIVQITRDTTT
jgi:hypothetical protein